MDAITAIVQIVRDAYADHTADGAMSAEDWFIGFGMDDDGLFREAMMEYVADASDGDKSIWDDLGIDRCGYTMEEIRMAARAALGMADWRLEGEEVVKE